MTPIQQVEAESSLARAMATCVTDVMEGEWGDREWLHLFVDFEIDDSGERSSSIAFALARVARQPLEKVSFRLSAKVKRQWADLAAGMQAGADTRWNSAQLRVEQDGRYSLQYSYAPPFRLGGNLHDTRFNDYLEQWLGTDEGAVFRPRSWRQRWLGR